MRSKKLSPRKATTEKTVLKPWMKIRKDVLYIDTTHPEYRKWLSTKDEKQHPQVAPILEGDEFKRAEAIRVLSELFDEESFEYMQERIKMAVNVLYPANKNTLTNTKVKP